MKSNSNHRWKFFLILVLLFLGIGVLALPYFQPKRHNIAEVKFGWVKYTHSNLGFSLEYPDVYEIDIRSENNVVLSYQGTKIALVQFLSEEEGQGRGLWFNHQPIDEIQLGDRNGDLYFYNHSDGLADIRTLSYVVNHQEKKLALEFRLERVPALESILVKFGLRPLPHPEPDEIRDRILKSFQFDQ